MRSRRSPPPLDARRLERLALRYVERFATTRGKLVAYLRRKLIERGWDDAAEPDPVALAERCASMGYIDEAGFAEAKAAAMDRRGLGARRVAEALRIAHIDTDAAAAVTSTLAETAEQTAIAFARKHKLGPFSTTRPDIADHRRQIAKMVRAGHDYAIANRVLKLDAEAFDDDGGAGGFSPGNRLC